MPREKRSFLRRNRWMIRGALISIALWVGLFAWIGANSDMSKGVLDGLFYAFAWFPVPLILGGLAGSFLDRPD